MPTQSAPVRREIFQLKITLLDTEPAVWRRVLVPVELTLPKLHRVLQVSMGWEDCHLHEFRIAGQCFGTADPMEMFAGTRTTISERSVRLCDVLCVRSKAVYHYDFGDDWMHSVVVEKLLMAEPGVAYPLCIGGERSCPPEDCGGVYGYGELLEAGRNPENHEHGEFILELAEDFDPEQFSIDDVNRKLAPMQRSWLKK